VYHVTLDPSLDAIRARIEQRGGMDITPDGIAEHVEWMRARYRDWTCRIDNTAMTPAETVAEIARRIAHGEGHITGPLPPI